MKTCLVYSLFWCSAYMLLFLVCMMYQNFINVPRRTFSARKVFLNTRNSSKKHGLCGKKIRQTWIFLKRHWITANNSQCVTEHEFKLLEKQEYSVTLSVKASRLTTKTPFVFLAIFEWTNEFDYQLHELDLKSNCWHTEVSQNNLLLCKKMSTLTSNGLPDAAAFYPGFWWETTWMFAKSGEKQHESHKRPNTNV